MPYSNKTDVETWCQKTNTDIGSIGYDYDNTIQYLINIADRAIDDYCNVPDDFFNAGGVEIQQEYHDGVEVGHYGLLVSFGLSIKRRPFLRLEHSPVLSVTTLEKSDSAGTWSTLTEGRQNDYLVMETGIRFLRNVPSYDYKNVRVTYKAGYAVTPGRIPECSARLAAATAHAIIDAKKMASGTSSSVSMLGISKSQSSSSSVGGTDIRIASSMFTDELKLLVRRYRRKVPVKML